MKKYSQDISLDANSCYSMIFNEIKPGSTVLEFGCAYGRMTKVLKEKNCKVYGIELVQEAYDEANKYLSDGLCDDIERYTWVEKFGGIKFDAILFADVLEHLKNPEKVLKTAADFLNTDGFIICSVPNIAHSDILAKLFLNRFDYTNEGLLDNTHIHFWGYNNLLEMVNMVNLYPEWIKGVIIPAHETEQAINLDEFTVINELYNKDYGNVYQFVLKLYPKEYAAEKGMTYKNLIPLSQKAGFKVYYNLGNGYTEKNAQYFPTASNYVNSQICISSEMKSIRIDPVEGTGCFIYNLSVSHKDKELPISSCNGMIIGSTILFDTTDPMFEFDVSQISQTTIDVRYKIIQLSEGQVEKISNAVTNTVNKEKDAFISSHIVDFVRNQNENVAISDSLQRIASQMEYIASFEKQVAQGIDYNTKLKEKENQFVEEKRKFESIVREKSDYIETLNKKILLLENEIKNMFSELEEKNQLAEYNDQLRLSIESVSSELAECRKNILQSKAIIKENQENISELQRINREAQSRVNSILYSQSWKITAPLRRVLDCIKGIPKSEYSSFEVPKICNVVDVLMPISDSGLDAIKTSLESFFAQDFVEKHMIFIVAQDTSADVKEVLNDYTRNHVELDMIICSDIKISSLLSLYPLKNYVCILYPGDRLITSAMRSVNLAMRQHTFDFAYSDSRIICGNKAEYCFKPDFSLDYLHSMNYIGCGLILISAELMKRISETDADLLHPYDLLLQLADYSSSTYHLSEILYTHFKDVSVIKEDEAEVLCSHFKRKKINANIKLNEDGTRKIIYEIQGTPKVTIIIPNKDHLSELKPCIDSILNRTTYKNYKIVIVENNSTQPETFKYYKKLAEKNIKIVNYKGKFNYSAINNEAVKQTDGEYLVFLNNDTEIISENWLQEMLMLCARNDVGAVGAKLYYPDGRIQHAGVILGIGGVAAHANRLADGGSKGYMNRMSVVNNYSAVTGACLMTKRDLFNSIGGFNENLPVDFNDVDLCMKIGKAKLNILYTPYAELLHKESISRDTSPNATRSREFAHSVSLFRSIWKTELENGDPYYNSNFDMGNADFKYSECSGISEAHNTVVDESQMSIAQKLNLYLDESNYERAQDVMHYKQQLNIDRTFTKGLSIVILNLNKPELIIPLLNSLIDAKRKFEEDNFELEILVGDTGSTDKKVLEAYELMSKDVKVVYDMKYNFSSCNNEVFMKFVSHDLTLFLNNDIVFTNSYYNLKSMMKPFENKKIGIVGSYLFYPDDCVQHLGIDFFKSGEAEGLCYHPMHHEKLSAMPPLDFAANTPATTGACLMIKSELFVTIDGFDNKYLEECQDVALCLSARKLGYEIYTVYSGMIRHLENATRKKGSECWKDRRRFLRKWKSFIEVI